MTRPFIVTCPVCGGVYISSPFATVAADCNECRIWAENIIIVYAVMQTLNYGAL